MKILHIINDLGAGGAEKLIEELVPIMNKEDDIEIEIFLLNDKKKNFMKNLYENKIKIDVAKVHKVSSFINIFLIRNKIVSGNYDIVHVHLFPSIYWTSLSSILIFNNRPKMVFTEHNTHNRRRDIKYLKLIEKYIYSKFDIVISISKETQNKLIKWINPNLKNVKKFCVIENGIDLDKFKNAIKYKKSELLQGIEESKKIICMTGSFNVQKDQKTLIESMKYLKEDVILLLVGEGPLRAELEEFVYASNLNNRVFFLGFRNDIEKVLKSVDIVVQSSNWEGFGLAALEGMACEKPLIASNVEGLREVVSGAGLLFEVGDKKKLAEIINELLSNSKLYEEVSKLSIKKANNYSIKKMSDSYIEVYKKLEIIKG